ncbi:putative NADH:ubiquinone oxidoreductase intermediate-associated protein [Rosa chinensis]|uniref:Putative NADH:ubiquinone oxidoreductase intermediate-associated protein n=1 Tax=Rosa chinensis TaxID=74649 RepID=A0A2P6SQM2_ROSCH|nr:probable complex I intermediate-associated protein 30 [Rosa chinensis]PRQ60975.1 putative NADH:ubiquinone oxidoreductase intermediate-associated protein [Rosa chinensis]
MKNLINALKQSVGLQNGKLLFGYEGNNYRELTWGALDDVVMGGVSESTFLIDPNGSENGGPTGLFKGVVFTAYNGGFTSIRTKNLSTPEDLSAYDGIELRLKGDGRCYKLILRTSGHWDTVGYTAGFDTVKDQWQTVSITMVLSIFLWPNQESLARWFELPQPSCRASHSPEEQESQTFRLSEI